MTDPTERVITNERDFRTIWAQIHADKVRLPKLPTVDFTKEMLLVVGMGNRPNGGHAISIDSVEDYGEGFIRVHYMMHSAGAKCITTASITAPAQIARLDRRKDPVRFQAGRRVTDCE